MSHPALSAPQLAQYQRDGFVIVPGVFSAAECQSLIAHCEALLAGRVRYPGAPVRQPGERGRTHNQHIYDPVSYRWLLDPRLRQMLADCLGGEADAVQTMHFFEGSQQRRHQDAYYLPSCISAWIALEPVSERNGTIWVQPGSHTGKLLTRADFVGPDGKPLPTFGEHYNNGVDQLAASHGTEEVVVRAETGSVVLFHGTLIHRGGPIGEPGSSRHVHACHYVPHDNTDWHYGGWPRISFDHVRHHGHRHG